MLLRQHNTLPNRLNLRLFRFIMKALQLLRSRHRLRPGLRLLSRTLRLQVLQPPLARRRSLLNLRIINKYVK